MVGLIWLFLSMCFAQPAPADQAPPAEVELVAPTDQAKPRSAADSAEADVETPEVVAEDSSEDGEARADHVPGGDDGTAPDEPGGDAPADEPVEVAPEEPASVPDPTPVPVEPQPVVPIEAPAPHHPAHGDPGGGEDTQEPAEEAHIPAAPAETHHVVPSLAADRHGPMEQPESDHATGLAPSTEAPWQALLPRLPMRGFFNGLLLLVLTIGWSLLAQIASSVRLWLAPTGLLVRVAQFVEVFGRALAVLFGLGVLAAWAPAPIAVALPWVALVAALAFGWSARDVLPDVIAWMSIISEGRIRRGRWIQVPGMAGQVRSVGLRATVLVDDLGVEHSVPNRVLVGAVAETPGRWPRVEVELRLPVDASSDEVRNVLCEAALASPWVASSQVEVLGDTTGEGTWRVRAHLLEGRFSGRFEGALRERVMHALGQR